MSIHSGKSWDIIMANYRQLNAFPHIGLCEYWSWAGQMAQWEKALAAWPDYLSEIQGSLESCLLVGTETPWHTCASTLSQHPSHIQPSSSTSSPKLKTKSWRSILLVNHRQKIAKICLILMENTELINPKDRLRKEWEKATYWVRLKP